MMDYLADDRYELAVEAVECIAYDEQDLQTCPCGSCRAWRHRQGANAVYQRKYEQEMEAVRRAAKRSFYRDWTVPR